MFWDFNISIKENMTKFISLETPFLRLKPNTEDLT